MYPTLHFIPRCKPTVSYLLDKYNTASAIAVTEVIKLGMSGCLWWRDSERIAPPTTLFFTYTILAFAYAVNNQLAMYLLTNMGTLYNLNPHTKL